MYSHLVLATMHATMHSQLAVRQPMNMDGREALHTRHVTGHLTSVDGVVVRPSACGLRCLAASDGRDTMASRTKWCTSLLHGAVASTACRSRPAPLRQKRPLTWSARVWQQSTKTQQVLSSLVSTLWPLSLLIHSLLPGEATHCRQAARHITCGHLAASQMTAHRRRHAWRNTYLGRVSDMRHTHNWQLLQGVVRYRYILP